MFLVKIYLSICPNSYEFFQIFFNFRNFVFSFEKTKFGYIFAKRIRTTLKKFLDNRSKGFEISTQTFSDKRGFQSLEKNLKKFVFIRTNWLRKSYVTSFFVEQFFFTHLLINF